MFGLSLPELLMILLVILLLFGGYKNIPELARNLGKSLGAFKKGLKDPGEDEGREKSGPGAQSGEK